jgi:hypothetical protein
VWIFIIFWPSKIHTSPTGVVYLPFLSSVPPLLWPTSSRAATCHTSFPLSQDELAASTLSSDNALSRRRPSRAKTEALNPHHHLRVPSLVRSTPTLHCYKKIISILATLLTPQLHLYFVSSLVRAPHNRSSTRLHHSLSLLSYAHHPSAQWHPQWATSQLSFAFRITYWHVNSHKKIFWNTAASRGVIN